MSYNPYEFMLEVRNNRILFQYLETAAVYFTDDNGWSIQGDSDLGKTEIYQLTGGEVIRITLPIPVPHFITIDILHKIVDGLNTSIEGVCTVAEEEALFIEYHLHVTRFGELDTPLLKFLTERNDINKGFSSLEEDYLRMKDQVSSTMEELGRAMNGLTSNQPTENPGNINVTTDDISNMDSLWSDMENIDKKSEDEGDTPESI